MWGQPWAVGCGKGGGKAVKAGKATPKGAYVSTPVAAPMHPAQQATGEISAGHGEVRYEDAQSAMAAMKSLNGVPLNGSPLTITPDPSSKDRTKLIITGLSADVQWQELKDHFKQIPNLAFVEVKGGNGKPLTGEVRYDSPAAAQHAVQMLQGSEMAFGAKISIALDPSSKDGTKLIVTGIPPGSGWQELKDHFNQAGQVAYANVLGRGSSSLVGEVRYDDPEHTKLALNLLNGSDLRGSLITVEPAPNSTDSSKLVVRGIGAGTAWQELKDHFAQIGQVAFADVSNGKKGGEKGSGAFLSYGAWPMAMAGGGGPYSTGGGKGKGGNNMVPVMMMVPAGPNGQPLMGKGGKPMWA